jgi:pimeloyl-ACP methyl ester carboxylesterase
VKFRVLDAGTGLWAVLLHGFTRNGSHLETLAQALFADGIGSIRPDLGSFNWFRSVNNATYLDRVAQRIGATLTGPAVLIGHSAGGAAAAHVASRLDDVAGIVFVDANESPTHLIERAWPDISHLPTFAICAPPSRCNRDGAFARWAQLHGVDGCVGDGKETNFRQRTVRGVRHKTPILLTITHRPSALTPLLWGVGKTSGP